MMTTPHLGRLDAPPRRAPTGLRRSATLLRLYRREPEQPRPFYEFLADDTLRQLSRCTSFATPTPLHVVDVGGGPSYLADVVRANGHRCTIVDRSTDELHLHGRQPTDAVAGDAQALPIRDGAADVVHCSNVLEHVRQPWALLSELVRVLATRGLGYMSCTPWRSPWGGHETSPWHYLGGERAVERYTARTGHPPKNRYGTSLFELSMADVRRWFRASDQVEVLWDGPRYWPPSFWPLARVPVVGEVLTWNYLVMFRRIR